MKSGGLPAACLLLSLALYADDWPGPQVCERFSPSRQFMVRVVPGSNWGETFGFKGAAKGPFAKAEWYRQDQSRSYVFLREISLVNPVAPVEFFVMDSGHLITFDNWHNVGYGKVAVFYGADGAVMRSYALVDLFTPHEMSQFTKSESSIWWHKGMTPPRDGQQLLLKGQKNFCITTGIKDRDIDFELDTGRYVFRKAGYCGPY